MNSHQSKCCLLLWPIGLSFFNIFVLLVDILLVSFVLVLLRRCAAWKAKSQLKHRNHIMRKLNLVEPPPHSDVAMQSSLQLPTVSSVVLQPVPTLKLSYDDTSQQLEAQKELVIKFAHNLQTKSKQLPFNTSPFSRIT